MNIYWIIAILTLVLNRILPTKTNREYLRNLIISFIPLLIYAAIRVDYGNDYSAYEDFFDRFHHSGMFVGDSDEHAEIGYQYLCYIMPSFRSMLVLSAALLYSSLVLFLYKNIPQKWAWLAIILIFLMPEKNVFGILVGMRNGMVISCLLLVFSFIQMRKPIPVLVVTAMLGTIHSSALAYIPFAYVVARNTPVTKTEFYIWIGMGGVTILLSDSNLVGVMLPFVSLISEEYEEKLIWMDEVSRGLINYVANIIMMASFLYYAYIKDIELTPGQKSLLRMAALYCVSGCLGTLSGRMTYYFAMYYIGGVVVMYSAQWKQEVLKNAMLAFVILIACYATFIVWMGSPWWNHTVYHSLLD